MGSNPATPTKEKGFDNQWFDAVFKAFFIIKIFILLIKKKEFLGSVVILGGLSLVNSLHAYTFASLKR
ncbi:hypothetical protein, partial [Phocaeicola vulgatus]|uniref:hypothetical protein n=1 Tax=Phocaeicola vulgatus TaxID=821 RepID=UPI003564C580